MFVSVEDVHDDVYYAGMTNSSPSLPPEVLTAARVLAGLSQAELCELAGVGRGTLQKMEAPDGPRNARPKTTTAVLQALARRSVSIAIAEDGGYTLHYRLGPSVPQIELAPRSLEDRLAEAEALISGVRAELTAAQKG